MRDVKIFGMYLPQYHRIPENDKFWGEGFTDWVAVKNAESLYPGHDQPRVPYEDNYYDLSDPKCLKWQAELAKEYCVSGWGIYHYWFSSEHVLLTKPAEIILANKDIDIPFFFAWDNISWRRTWSKLTGNAWSPKADELAENKSGPEILVEYKLGREDEWTKHFDYLLPYFSDDRYIKRDNKPVFIVFNYDEKILEMNQYWDKLAKEHGFSGMEIIFKNDPLHVPNTVEAFSYEPQYSGWLGIKDRTIGRIKTHLVKDKPLIFSYDTVWKKILKNARKNSNALQWHGAFVGYDDTPRRGTRGRILEGGTPEKFGKYLDQLVKICEDQGKEFVFITAWNEWGEGAYLEPDKKTGFGYLEAIKKVMTKE